MFVHVVEARYIQGHTVWLRFNDGTSGEVDLSGELSGPIFAPLRDVEVFKQFTLAYHSLTWENGAEFAPEFLREHIRVTA